MYDALIYEGLSFIPVPRAYLVQTKRLSEMH